VRHRTLLLKIGLILTGFAWIWLSRVPPGTAATAAIQAPQEGFLAPDFELATTTGDIAVITEMRGQALIVNFWASWCPPCRAEMPAFQQIREEFSGSDLAILGVNVTSQDARADVEDFLEQYQLEFTIPLDISGQASRTYQIHSLPTTFFINKEGIIEKVIVGGPIPLSLLRVEARQILE
jgi:cytochrome c biogenesis protein CcmG/thiol:disulfide interchange protein DsbE